MSATSQNSRVDITKPRYDQSTYLGRAKHFFQITNPLNILCSDQQLKQSKKLVELYKKGEEPLGTTMDEVWNAKNLYDSAYHPDTGEKQFILGRMSAQVPCNAVITAAMLTFYKSVPAVVFWQWVNQSFNALVNYTNRSGGSNLTTKDIGTAYIGATTGAVGTALLLKSLSNKMPPLFGRLIPFISVAAANCINIPLMRIHELKNGIPIYDINNNHIGNSINAAKNAITMVVFSRIVMCSPSLVIPPISVNYLIKKYPTFRNPKLNVSFQILLVVLCFLLATPMCCAIFPQNASMKVDSLEESLLSNKLLSDKLLNDGNDLIFFNKGL